MPLPLGSDLFGDFVPGHDAFAVRRLREAGFVIVGKTSLPEFGILPVTEPRRFGPTRNPWDPERTPGGSSRRRRRGGGRRAWCRSRTAPTAAARSASPRPAAGWWGSSRAAGGSRAGPSMGDDFLVQDGVLTRTVADTAALLDVLAGYEPGDASWAPPPAEPFARTAAREPGRLRIGVTTGPGRSTRPRRSRSASARCATPPSLLESLGHEVEEVDPPWEGQDLLRAFTLVFGDAGRAGACGSAAR